MVDSFTINVASSDQKDGFINILFAIAIVGIIVIVLLIITLRRRL